MVLLTIEDIAKKLKTFAKDVKLPPQPPRNLRNMLIDLNSEAPLPDDWEQCLDIKTGEIYYVNMISGEKTNKYFEMPNITEPNSDDESDDGNSSGSGSQSLNSVVINPSPKVEPTEIEYLVLIGCTACLKYMMVAKSVKKCPKCGGGKLVLFEEGGCA
ncbi:protein CURLY FLAG LEAF 1-like [Typha angustifolia]|uniref:protein CURLY FLAG LEAF 1-like n=1 Tax=Typha angustifolia TaxID=59011 RepID=UPI003C2D6F82